MDGGCETTLPASSPVALTPPARILQPASARAKFGPIAGISGVSLRPIRNWASDGLPVMDGTQLALIRRDVHRDHIMTKRESRSIKTQIGTFFCFGCRKDRGAAEGMADCEIKDGRAKLTALCETCEKVVSKPVAEALIPEIARTLDLKITRHLGAWITFRGVVRAGALPSRALRPPWRRCRRRSGRGRRPGVPVSSRHRSARGCGRSPAGR